MRRQILFGLLAAALASPALASDERGQLGQIGGALKRVDQFRDVQMTDTEEAELGALVSDKVRARYGVVQDAKVHRYVALVGSALASVSSRPNLPWTFIVLDTDAVNAFAAPGGYLHITRGALAVLQSEAELAGVLAHEIIHVTEKHTIRAIQKSKTVQMGASETFSSGGLKDRLTNAVYDNIVDKGFGRAEENESDEKGIALVNTLGYAPQGLGAFLTRLQERNKDSKEKRGLFASHPEMKERLDRLARQITRDKLVASATLADRYKTNISFKPVPITEIAVIEPGTAGLTGGGEKPAEKPEEKKAEEEPKKRSGLGGLGRMLPSGGGEKKSAQVTSSASARGVDPERDAKGGPNPKPVVVKVAAADVAAFKKEGGLKP